MTLCYYRPAQMPRQKGPSYSIIVETRKIANYTCIERSQRQLGWTFEAVLTCNSMVNCEFSGERLIELSCWWFSPKFSSE